MSDLNALFRKRVGISANERISFENLDTVMGKAARAIPFENLSIMEERFEGITKHYLISKILINNEGGLCYELNTIFYYFLMENGFKADLTIGVVFNQDTQQFVPLGRTHVTILMSHENQVYVVDTGFGGNVPLKPIPLTGDPQSSANGQFRIRKENSEYGDCVLEMKLTKNKDSVWRTGYAFDSKSTVTHISEVNNVQNKVAHDPRSTFNKKRMITRFTDQGMITLTETSFTEWNHDSMIKEEIEGMRFKQLLKKHFGQKVYS